MNSPHLSDGKKFLVTVFWVLLSGLSLPLGLIGCAQSEKEPPKAAFFQNEENLKISSLRQGLSPEVRDENDELANLLHLMGQVKLSPERVLEKYQTLHRKKREAVRKIIKNRRSQFAKNERLKKKFFLKTLRKEKENFRKKKRSREKSVEFFADQNGRRREYFSDERDRRRDFESETRQQSRDFSSDLREKKKAFYSEFQVYRKRFSQKKDQVKRRPETLPYGNNQAVDGARRDSRAKGLLRTGFDEMRDVPAQKLEVEE